VLAAQLEEAQQRGRDEWYRRHGRGWGDDRGHWDHGLHNGWR
jgi:hypothetical protein